MTTEYRIAPAPKHSGLVEWDCAICHHESLTRPVFIDNGSGVIAAGSGCAARALGLVPANHVGRLPAKVTNAMESEGRRLVVEAALVEERMESATRALDAFDCNRDADEDLARWRRNFISAKKFGNCQHVLLRPYLLAGSQTGEV
jgi:hypothetical protein